MAGHADASERALILVADPDVHVRALERYFLEQAGFEVELVSDGEEGLARARTLRPAVVITEILLPRRDGLSICRALKTDPATKSIPVVVFSILAAEDRAQHAGADAFVKKPIDDAELIAAVRALLNTTTGGGEP